jgi:hypothetical protein
MTWRQRQGYGGFVTHYWGNSLRYIGPAVTQHVGIINGYIHLFEATDDLKWLKEAKVVARHLLNLQDPSLFYSFKYSGLETNSCIFSRVRSLLTNSWADSALLRLIIKLKEINDADWEGFKRSVDRNVKYFLLRTLWDPYQKRFFSNFEVSIRNVTRYYNPNKNCAALETLSLFSEVNRDYSIVEDYCLPICDWVSNDLVVTSNDSRRGAILQEPLGIGGGVYSVYNAVCLRGFYEMYRVTQERRLLSVVERISEFLLRNIDDCGAFYSHYDALGKLHKYPYLVAPQSIIVLFLLDLKKPCSRDMSRSVRWILENQTAIGGFPTF